MKWVDGLKTDVERIGEFNSVYEQHNEELKATWLRLIFLRNRRLNAPTFSRR